jgi:hypothetical protein
MSGLLSDRHRFAKIVAVAAALILLVLYASVAGPKVYPTFDEARRDPAAFSGRRIFFGGDIVRVGESDFSFRTWDHIPVTARPGIGGGQLGYRISGTAVFRADGTLDVLSCHVYRFRVVKNLLAVLPLLIVGWFFFRKYTFDPRKLMFQDRRGAGGDHA